MRSRIVPALVVVAMLAGTAAARGVRCPGRYVVPAGTPLPAGTVIVVAPTGAVEIAGTCPPRRRAVRGKAKVRARWGRCAHLRSVRLAGVLADGCARLEGTLRAGRGKKAPFTAARSVCGDGVVDAGEACDGPVGCPTACDDECRCPPPTTTTATLTTTTSTTTTTTAPPLAGLPDDVREYRTWLRMNAAPIPVHGIADAHFGTKDVWVNQTRETLAPGGIQRLPFPAGTILVKESTRPGRDFVGLVSVMRKRPGLDPAHGDWEFVELARGQADAPFEEVGRGEICWSCHAFAETKDQDWVYTPLDPAPAGRDRPRVAH